MRKNRQSISGCSGQFGGNPALSLVCVAAAAVGGAVHRSRCDKYKNRVTTIIDMLEQYDEMGLEGINVAARNLFWTTEHSVMLARHEHVICSVTGRGKN